MNRLLFVTIAGFLGAGAYWAFQSGYGPAFWLAASAAAAGGAGKIYAGPCRIASYRQPETDCGKHRARRAPIHAKKIWRQSGIEETDRCAAGDFVGDLI